ncbi:MAG: MltA domain-containing protein, partial [Nitrospirota bacterium]
MKKINRRMLPCLLMFMCLSVMDCSLFVKPPTGPRLEQLTLREARSYDWTDDLGFEGMEQAIEQSMKYYRRLPAYKTFQYGDITYTPDEMAASLELFLSILNKYQGAERTQQLSEKFIFFESRNGDGGAFFTGYYEPVIEGRLEPEGAFSSPLYERPDDLVDVNLGLFSDRWKNEHIVGRLEGTGLIPYDSRDEIVYGDSLRLRARPIAYVKEIELFFLQIQGSGLIKLPAANMLRVNYAASNGRPYRAVGALLKDSIPPDKMSLQAIKEYLYSHPDEVKSILSYNQSYTFFRETGEGPLGNIEEPLTAGRSIAMDRKIVPGGGLAYIETKLPVFENGRLS